MINWHCAILKMKPDRDQEKSEKVTTSKAEFELQPEALYQACNLEKFDFTSTTDLENLSTTIGQDRALDAINFAVEMHHNSFNLYVMGSSGLGRHSLVRDALKETAEIATRPDDWCYVSNFQHPHSPYSLKVPAGTGCSLRSDMHQLIENLINTIPAVFQGDEYQRRHHEILQDIKAREDAATSELEAFASQNHILLVRGPNGFTLTPEKDGQALSSEDFDALPEQEQQDSLVALETLKNLLKDTMNKAPEWQNEIQTRMRLLDQEAMSLTVNQFIKGLEEKYAKYQNILKYLASVKDDLIENVEWFRKPEGSKESSISADDPVFNRYKVNILVDNSETKGAPIVFEDNPTYQNLTGRIEHIADMGTLQTDFTLIKAGALHRANGGYLILDADKVLLNYYAWEGLKRVLYSREIRIQSLERQLSLASTISLEPAPISVDLKVVLIGSRNLFYMLNEYDPEFSLLFKVGADFSEELPRDDENEFLYARLIATLQHREGLREIERDGVARIIEEAARRTWDSEKLSLHMGSLLDLLREADYHARKNQSLLVRRADVQAAIDAQMRRANQWQEKLLEEIIKDTIRIDTQGRQLAQVNGLTVLKLGDYMFGSPTRITATARLGSGELIDIERESEQGGEIHSKGVMILSSYLGERYAKHQPLSLSASLAFEQTYTLVDGDSASAAELCALISAIADVPIKQSLAITGSINQHGQMQAVGGVCEKIEGFFDLCNKRVLSGEQGVIIPASNVRHLMLKQEVIDAVKAGKFHIYAVDHVDQALTILTDLPAGQINQEGIYPQGTLNFMVQYRLTEWLALRQHFASPESNH